MPGVAALGCLGTGFGPNVGCVADVCGPDPSAAASLLADALGPVEWAAFKHVTSLLHEALTPPAATSNGLTASALAALLAEVWFSKMPTSYAAAGEPARLPVVQSSSL